MKKKYLLMPFAAMLLLAGCDYNDKYFDGLEDKTVPTDVKKLEYTLTDADYATIADNKTNKSIAKEAGLEGALSGVKTQHSLSDEIPASLYLPAFLSAKWYTADAGSSVKITYNKRLDVPEYLSQIAAAKSYKLASSDYALAWEDGEASYFTPSKPASTYLPRILKNQMPDAQTGDYVAVEYQYSDNEPGGGGSVETYQKVVDAVEGGVGEYNVKGSVVATYGRGFLLSDGTASILVYLNKAANYSLGDVVAVKGTTALYSGLKQFSATAEIKKLSKGETFPAPTFQNMDAAAMDAYLNAPVAKPIKYTGKLSISGNYYNVAIEGAEKATGSISYPNASLIDKALDGKEVTVMGYGIGVSSGKFVNTIAMKVIAEGEPEYTSVGEVALAQPGSYDVKGIIVAKYKRGFLVNDGTGSILVYLNADPKDYEAGDIVTVSGTTSSYSGLNQYSGAAVISKVGTASVPQLEPYAMSTADIDAYVEAPYAQYVSYKGTLIIDGNYYNVVIDGTTVQGSLSYPSENVVDASLNGKEVIVTGYSIGVSGKDTKYLNTMAVSVVDASAAPAASYIASTRAANGEKKYAIYQFNGVTWSAGENMAMVNPDDYKKMGLTDNNFSASEKPDKYLAQFLALTYPYGQEGDKKAAVYHFYDSSSKETTIGADEYVFTNGAWSKNTNIEVITDQFVFDGKVWNYDPSVVIRLQKNDAFSKEFLQVIVDWVKENIDEKYIDRGNTEYYYGCSAYYGNVEMSISYFKKYYPDLADAELEALIKEHLEEGVFIPALQKYYPDADTVEGIEVTYTVTFDVHKATGAGVYTMKYLVTGKGQFEPIKGSLQEVS